MYRSTLESAQTNIRNIKGKLLEKDIGGILR